MNKLKKMRIERQEFLALRSSEAKKPLTGTYAQEATKIPLEVKSIPPLRVRSDTHAHLLVENPIVPRGEIVFDVGIGGIKIGDGVSAFNNLPYLSIPFKGGEEDNGN